ncbi:MAG TPA: 3-methyl-2-oxobutanoate hydroxymethyltransferase [Vicinamibacterales bacterium]|nr:3-methyl-2-oxobutanoate hydroxymethyltransferase [Vicinamibacterales bacterium]
METRVTVPMLQRMKRDGRKIVAAVVYDYQMAQIADRAGVEIVSVGDSVGVNFWGHRSELEVTLDEMVLVCRAVRRGVRRALVSCDMPYGPLQLGPEHAVAAAIRLIKEGGADLVKLDGAAEFPEAVRAVTRAGVPVWAQFGITPQTALAAGGSMAAAAPGSATEAADRLVEEARRLEAAGAVLLDFTNSGPVAGPAVARACTIPVLGGLGGGPWLDGRVRAVVSAIGYLASALDDQVERYANVARLAHEAIAAYADDVRAGRPLRGERRPAPV